jgi:AcrR family transcriptional regulator
MMVRMAATATPRMSAEERRATVLRAAMAEFAERGYHAASTSSIASAAGISQPYIYALYPNKKELFLACMRESCERIRVRFSEAAQGGGSSEERLGRMGDAYCELVEDRVELFCQLQGYASANDPEIRATVAKGFRKLFDEAERLSGAPREEIQGFFAHGMFLNVLAALDLGDELGGDAGGAA